MSNNEEKKCWKCDRIIVGKIHFGLCEKCYNELGSPVAILGAGGLLYLGKKYVPEAIKKLPEVIKRVKKL